jgi:hypothetical protein
LANSAASTVFLLSLATGVLSWRYVRVPARYPSAHRLNLAWRPKPHVHALDACRPTPRLGSLAKTARSIRLVLSVHQCA